MSFSEEINELQHVLHTLLGPNGCPWDRKQTLESLRDHIFEEYSEYLDALEEDDGEGVKEELGDVLFQILFMLKLAAKRYGFVEEEAVKGIREKLVRRHPHVFGDANISTEADLKKQWEAIKDQEKPDRKKGLERIPKKLPALQRGAAIAKMLRKAEKTKLPEPLSEEEQLGALLFRALQACEKNKFSPEGSLRQYLKRIEKELTETKVPEIISRHESNS